MKDQFAEPIGNRVLLKLPPAKRKEVGGIVTLEQDLAYEQTGTVVAMGKGRIGKTGKRIPFEFKIGDEVIITKFAGTQVKLNGEQHLMLFGDDVVGIKE